jgi:hypothetical protein
MTDDLRAAAFGDGRDVTFNAMVPTKMQGVVGVITRYLLLVIGIPCCAIVWGDSAS